MGSRSKRLFVPTEFDVPSELVTANFTLRMLSVDDVEKDFEAVISSAARLSQVWPNSGWPAGLTLRQNLIDLDGTKRSSRIAVPLPIRWWRLMNPRCWAAFTFTRLKRLGMTPKCFYGCEKVKRRRTWIRSYSRSCNTGWRRTGLSKILPILAEPLAGNTGTHCPLNKSASVPAQAHT